MLNAKNICDALFLCRGLENAVTANELVTIVTGEPPKLHDDRQVRKIVVDLRREGFPIGSHSNKGYYWAETPNELSYSSDWIRARSMHGLTVESHMRKRAMPALTGQQSLPIVEAVPKAEKPVSLLFEVPEHLYKELGAFLELHQAWSADGVIACALNHFLNKHGGKHGITNKP